MPGSRKADSLQGMNNKEDKSERKGKSEAISWALTMLRVAVSAVRWPGIRSRMSAAMGKFLSRQYADNVEAWERTVEPQLRLKQRIGRGVGVGAATGGSGGGGVSAGDSAAWVDAA